jgi:predicted Rossmann fold nucleotide-binding protein DprA/Smf involved in DNA uptake
MAGCFALLAPLPSPEAARKLEFGWEVFGVPNNVNCGRTFRPDQLIRQGGQAGDPR